MYITLFLKNTSCKNKKERNINHFVKTQSLVTPL